MKAFVWSDKFNTGLATVDEQHRKLVDLINQLGDQIVEDQVSSESIERIFTELFHYVEYHFSEEEAMMQQLGLDDRHLNAHLEIHQDFLKEMLAFYGHTSAESIQEVEHMLDFLIHWLVYHILGIDQEMAQQAQAIEQGLSAQAAYNNVQAAQDGITETLIVALNGLFKLVTDRNKELIELNQSLEQKVVERTQDLILANQKLKELASTDVLTGLPNRRYAMRRLSDLWTLSLLEEQPLVSMMIDADYFKAVNDTCGHEAGDQVLCALSRTLKDSFRNDDIVCRLGGDEFFVICPNTDLTGGRYIAELVRQAVAEMHLSFEGGAWHGSISVGVAARTATMSNYEELILAADRSVYAAKKAGRNCVAASQQISLSELT